jgi:hypothetical protein
MYKGNYTFPVRSTAAQSIQQGANAQAQMYASLGQTFGDAIGKYFQGKEEKEMAVSMAENPIALEVVYGNQGTVPTDPAERAKDMRGVMRASGGYQNFINRMENLELKQQNQATSNQLMDLRNLQMDAMRSAEAERELQKAGRSEFLDRLTKTTAIPQPDLPPLTPDERERLALRSESPEAFEASLKARGSIPGQQWRSPLIEDPSPEALRQVAGELNNPFAQQSALDAAAGLEATNLEKQKIAASMGLAFNAEQRAIAKADREVRQEGREISVLKFDGLNVVKNPISGQIGDRVTALKTKEEVGNFNDLIEKIEDLQIFADKREAEWWMNTDDKLASENLARQIQALMRVEVLGPGTVQQAERVILEQIAGDPTKFWSLKKGATGRRLLQNLKDGLIDKFENKLKTLGLKVGGGSRGASTGAPSSLPSGITGLKIEVIQPDDAGL